MEKNTGHWDIVIVMNCLVGELCWLSDTQLGLQRYFKVDSYRAICLLKVFKYTTLVLGLQFLVKWRTKHRRELLFIQRLQVGASYINM